MIHLLKKIKKDYADHPYFYLSLTLLVLLMALTLHPSMRGADGRRYLRWTHSFVYDQDLHLLNNFEATGGSYSLTPTGYIFELANIGTPLLWSPFYSAASLFLPAPVEAESYPADTPIQLLWLNFSNWVYVLLAGILTVAALRHWFADRVLFVAIMGILVGTPVFFYMVTYPMSIHPSMIFLSALLFYLWLAPEPKTPFLHYLTIGLVIGWLMLVVSYNIVFLLLPGASLLKDGVERRNWSSLGLNGLAIGLGGVIGFLPQMIVYGFLFGSPFYSPYAGNLLWSEPYLLETLFSTFHGLFFYAPVLLLVIPGLWWLRRHHAWTVLGLSLTWLALTYIVSTYVAWWAGSSFGNRYFLTLSPFLVLGLASFLQESKKWGLVLTILAMLWTIGLYLQFLSGVGLTSDSVIYSATELAAGQIMAFANLATTLPQLWVDWPWLSVPVILLPLFSLILWGVSRMVYGWTMATPGAAHFARWWGVSHLKVEITMVGVSLALILFIGLAGWRGEQTKATLASQGFYDKPHEVVYRQIREVAGRSGLVTRAMYHEYMGRPDKALADLQRASTLWKSDNAAAPTRLYLGPPDNPSLAVPSSLHLDYLGGKVRLMGYHLLEAKPDGVKGELFWEKLPEEDPEKVVTPIIRAFDETGRNLGSVTLDTPFPAYYIPAGGRFKDTFSLTLDHPPTAWVWLAVSLAEAPNALPLNAQGDPESGFIASVNLAAFPAVPLNSSENPHRMMPQPILLLGDAYHRGQTIPIQLTWQDSDSLPRDTRFALNLFDSAGKVVAHHQLPIPKGHDVTNYQFPREASNPTTLCFPLPTDLPVGDYQLAFTLQSSQAGAGPDQREVFPIHLSTASAGSTTTVCDLLQATFSRRYEPTTPQNLRETFLTPEMKLVGYDLAVVPQPDSLSAQVVLHWQAQTNVRQDYRVSVQLLDAAGQPVVAHTSIPDHDARPTSTWLKGEWILDEHLLTVPPLAPGTYRLSVALIEAQTGSPVAIQPGQTDLILQEVQIP